MTVSPLPPGRHECGVRVYDAERTYYVCVPRRVRSVGDLWPIVLAFHGNGTHALQMEEFSGLSEAAERFGFVVVYPQGSGRVPRINSWNAGNCCAYAHKQKIDDVKFVDLLLDDLARRVPVDIARVYATGMSNGAMMCYRLANELAPRLAAIAPVAGTMGQEECRPGAPVPVIHFHGEQDEFVPLAGGRGPRSTTQIVHYSVEHSIRAWVAANGCSPFGKTTTLPIRVDDGTSAIRTDYSGGREGSEVSLISIAGMGHTWPGRETHLAMLGPVTKNVDANELMWEFFQRHRRK